MELHAVHGGFAVAQAHNDAVVGRGGGFQDVRHALGYDRKRVVAGRGEGAGHVLEDGNVLVHHLRGLAVHQFGGVGNGAAKSLSNGLVAQADAQQGLLCLSRPADGVNDDAGFTRALRGLER